MQQVQVGTTDSRASDLQDDIAVLDDDRARNRDDFDFVLCLPDQRLHGLGRVSVLGAIASWVRDILGRDGVATVADDLFDQVCSLGERHVAMLVWIDVLGGFQSAEYLQYRMLEVAIATVCLPAVITHNRRSKAGCLHEMT